MPLCLDLLRHGEALPSGASGDAERSLSPAGQRAVTRVAEECARRAWRPDRVYASPLRRAQETATIVLSRLAPGGAAETLRELVPDHEPEDLVLTLERCGVSGHVLLVGHQPQLGRLAAYLTGEREPGLPPAGLVRITFADRLAPGAGVIEFQIRADQLG